MGESASLSSNAVLSVQVRYAFCGLMVLTASISKNKNIMQMQSSRDYKILASVILCSVGKLLQLPWSFQGVSLVCDLVSLMLGAELPMDSQ